MGTLYISLGITFAALVIVNISWIIINLYMFVVHGIESIVTGQTLIENIYYSTFLKWIILSDISWISVALLYAATRKNFRTDPEQFYLKKKSLIDKTTCVVIPAYNEELSIGHVVTDFLKQENVKHVLVIDNNSSDNTIDVAKKSGATVFKNEKNMGLGYSCAIGLKKSLEYDVGSVTLVESDGTFVADDLDKMMSYLDVGDMIVGTRVIQVLSEKGTQLGMIHVWGNYILAKLIQLKFFSLLHIGSVSLTDVGCIYRVIRKDSLEKIIGKFIDPDGLVTPNYEIALFLTIEALKQNLRLIEIPVIFKRRIGKSKIESQKKFNAIKIGFIFLWYILKS